MEKKVSSEIRHSVWQKLYLGFKRCVGFILSLIGLTVLLPVFLIVAIAIKLDDGGPVFFCQERLCRGGKVMKMYKFRSMKVNAEHTGSGVYSNDSDPRITRVGKILRKFSIDELPQLLNVLLGDMSLVGPRPLISDEYEIHEIRTRFGVYNVRPGVTGLAQINGRDTVSPVEKVHWDVRYLEHFSLWMDIKILCATVPKIFGGVGVVEGFGSTAAKGEEKGA